VGLGNNMEKLPSEKRGRQWLRVWRPLFWWLMLVLVMLGIRTHQRLMEKTRLDFNVTLQEQAVDANATFDGKPAFSGQNISLGSHTFVVSHPKGETYSTNLFVWYGDHNFGTIDLKRTFGTLSVTANPPAPFLIIRGPEWSATLTNSSGLTKSVPTDAYEIEAEYPHWRKTYQATVFANQTTPFNIAPHFGGLQLGCNQPDATFHLQVPDGEMMAEGMLPFGASELPAGNYKIMAVHHGHQRTETVMVNPDTTTNVQFDFQYGAVIFETSPYGAAVVSDDGRNWGETPLTLAEVLPGNWTFTLQRTGYQSVQVSLTIAANQTNFVSTNLVSETYVHAFNSARHYMAAADYDRAVRSAGDALIAKPDDAEALSLQREATGMGHLQRAKSLGSEQDYIAGGKELTLALQSLPDDGEIKELMVSYKQHEPEQIERERVERLNRPKSVFGDVLGHYPDANLFDDHELTTGMPAKEAAAAIANALGTVQPAYKIAVNRSPKPEIYFISASQDDNGILTTSGRRTCIIVCGQTTDTNTEILFKVLEYKATHNVTMPGLLAFKDDMEFVPIHPSRIPDMTDKLKTQVQAGVSNLTARIQMRIGPAPAVSQ
jgi:hypothetical protein